MEEKMIDYLQGLLNALKAERESDFRDRETEKWYTDTFFTCKRMAESVTGKEISVSFWNVSFKD